MAAELWRGDDAELSDALIASGAGAEVEPWQCIESQNTVRRLDTGIQAAATSGIEITPVFVGRDKVLGGLWSAYEILGRLGFLRSTER